MFTPDKIPWQEIAFRSIRKTLELYCTDMDRGRYPVHLFDIA
jgi:hypothetical protein